MITYEDIKIKVNGALLPTPTNFSFSYEDLDSDKSLRDIKRGVLHRVRIREDVLKISLTYTLDELDTISKIMKMIELKDFNVETVDIKTSKRKTYKMYCSKKKFQLISIGRGVYAKGFSIDFTEC